jgi:hypothetical protein
MQLDAGLVVFGKNLEWMWIEQNDISRNLR